MTEEGGFTEDRSLAKRQELDNPEFLAGERQLFTIDQRQMAVQVNLKVADSNSGRAVAMRAADNGVEIGQQFEPVERLRQIAVGTGAKSGDLVVRAGIAGHDENGNRNVVLADQARQPGAVAIRQVDVEQYRIDVVMLEFRESGFDIVGCRLKVARFFERHAQNIGNNRIIFNNQNMHGFIPNIKMGQSWSDSPNEVLGGMARRKPVFIVKLTVIYVA